MTSSFEFPQTLALSSLYHDPILFAVTASTKPLPLQRPKGSAQTTASSAISGMAQTAMGRLRRCRPRRGVFLDRSEYMGQACTLSQYVADFTCGGTRTSLANWGNRSQP